MGGRTVDPAQMPRPPPAPAPHQVFETRVQGTHHVPPPADTPLALRDAGAAGPRYMRATLNYVPQSKDLLRAAALPLVLIINPLALPDPSDAPIPLVDMGPAGPLRCAACRAYVNPHMRWEEGGRRMVCCFCAAPTDVPPDYHSHLDLHGARRDREERPELSRGSVEFATGAEYQVRPPVPPTFFFLIEVTAGAVASGAAAAACASLARLLDELPGGGRTRVGVATFDSAVHFYALPPGGGPPQMLVMSDVAEPYPPLAAAAAAVGLRAHRRALGELLAAIPAMFAGSRAEESAGGAALSAAVAALGGGVGGRVVAFVSSLPRRGALALRAREAGRPPGERDPLDVMTPEGGGYAALAASAADLQVSVDLFVTSQGYVDLATMGALATGTSGSLHRYAPFSPPADAARLHNDLRWALTRPQGFEALGRLRVSAGLAVDAYVGAFHRRTPTDLNFPALSCDHALAARLVHDQRLREGSEAYAQYALLYTTTGGERRVRVHTLALPVTRNLGTVYKGADLDAYVSYVARKVSAQLGGRSVAACREVVFKSAVDTLAAYRAKCASASPAGQLILPENLRLMPLYALALSKAPCFRTDARADSRAAWAARLLSAPAERAAPAVYPRLLPLHGLAARAPGAPALPDRMWLTAAVLDPEGVYLLENGVDAYVYVGAAAPAATCAALLGVPSPAALDGLPPSGSLPELDTPLSVEARRVLDEVRRQRCAYLHLRLLRRGHPQEAAFLASLVEDKAPSTGQSYVQFLTTMHHQILDKDG
jgi:protein transport protein SEC24